MHPAGIRTTQLTLPDLRPWMAFVKSPAGKAVGAVHVQTLKLAARPAPRVLPGDATSLVKVALEAELYDGTVASELLARALAASGQSGSARAVQSLLTDSDDLHAQLAARSLRTQAFVAAHLKEDGLPALRAALAEAQAAPRGAQRRDIATFGACSCADYAAMTGNTGAAELAIEAANLIAKSAGRDDTLGIILRKLAIRNERDATTTKLLAIARDAAKGITDTHERLFTRIQLAIAEGQVGDKRAARATFDELDEQLGSKDTMLGLALYPSVFRGRTQAGFWDDAAPMLPDLERRFDNGIETITNALDMRRTILGRPPRELVEGIESLAKFGMAAIESITVSLATSGAWGPKEARVCIPLAASLVDRIPNGFLQYRANLHIAGAAKGTDPASASAAIEKARISLGDPTGAPLELKLKLCEAQLDLALSSGDTQAAASALDTFRKTRMAKQDREDEALNQIQHVVTLLEDERAGVTLFLG